MFRYSVVHNIGSHWGLKPGFSTVIGFALWFFFLWRAISTFGPASSYVFFNADCAIPILMANDERPVTIFNTYYYGQDRWGGWPFLIAQFIRSTTNYRWTDRSLFTMQALFIFVGVLVVANLSQHDGFVVILIYLLTISLHPNVRHQLFELSQVYAWQVTTLLLSWYSLRHLLDDYIQMLEKSVSWLRSAIWSFLIFLFSCLSIWASPVSVPILFFLTALEVLRIQTRTKAGFPNIKLLKRYGMAFIAVITAMCAEQIMKFNYHRYNMKHYAYNYKGQQSLDVSHLMENLNVQLNHIINDPWLPIILLPLFILLIFIVIYCYFLITKRIDLLKNMQVILSSNRSFLIIGMSAIAIMNFMITVIIDHVRLNDYAERYLTLTHLFGSLSGLLILFLILTLVAKSSSLRKFVKPAFFAAGVLYLALAFPIKDASPVYKKHQVIALALAQRAPRGVLLGRYWETYLFTSLQAVDAMIPVPLHGDFVRTPWTPPLMSQVDQVVVEYRQSKLGSWESPPLHLHQHGVSLRLVEPKWYENNEYAFALYYREYRENN